MNWRSRGVSPRSRRCPTCGRSWRERTARFCGRCGAPLAPPATTDDADPASATASRRTTAVVVAMALVVVAGLAGAALTTLGPPAPDPEVALPSDAAPSGAPLSDAEAGALREQVNPSRVRCEPRGCELWRRQRADIQGLATVADLVVLLEHGQLIALDGETGEERWREPVDDLLPFGGGAAPPGGRQQLVGTGDAVLVVGRSQLALVDRVGARRWTTPGAPTPVIDARVDGEVAVLAGDFGADGQRILVVDLAVGDVLFDGAALELLHADLGHAAVVTRAGRMEVRDLTADGRVLWARQLWQQDPDDDSSVPAFQQLVDVHHVGDGRIVVTTQADGTRLEVLDLVTGGVLWERPLPENAWPAAGERWISVPDGGSGHVVFDAASGRQVAAFDREVVHPFVTVGDHAVTVMVTGDPESAEDGASAELVALDGDGEVVWRVHLGDDDAWWCCTQLQAGEQLLVAAGADDERLRVDTRTGEVLEAWSDTRNGTGYFLRRWYAADGSRIQAANTGVTIEAAGRSVTILPNDVWPESDGPWVVGNATEVVGVRLMPAR